MPAVSSTQYLHRLTRHILSVPELPWRDRFRSHPEPNPGPPRTDFCGRVSHLVVAALLVGVLLVVPRHPRLNLSKSHIPGVDTHLADDPTVPIRLVSVHEDRLSYQLTLKILLRGFSIRLSPFRSVYPGQSHSVSLEFSVCDRDGVAVAHPDDLTVEFSGLPDTVEQNRCDAEEAYRHPHIISRTADCKPGIHELGKIGPFVRFG